MIVKKSIFVNGSKGFLKALQNVLKVNNLDVELFTHSLGKFYDYTVMDCSTKEDNIILNSSYCFVNMDNIHKNINIYGNIVTYGLGSKNTVTISSIEKDNDGFVYCLQRTLNHNSFGTILPRELPITMHFKNNNELYASMVGVTICLIEGVDMQRMKESLFVQHF